MAVVMAGDAQMDPSDLPALLDPVVKDEVDYAKGNRLTKIASGYWHVADSQCGYTAINLAALKRIDWDEMYKRYGQPNDLLVRLNIYNFRVRDVPVRPVYNIGEESGIKPLRMMPKLSWLLWKLFLYRMFQKYVIRDFHPLLFFYAMGMVLFPTGTLLGLYLLIWRFIVGPIAGTSALFSDWRLDNPLAYNNFVLRWSNQILPAGSCGSSGIRVEKELTTKRQTAHTPKSPNIRGVPVLTPRMHGDLGVCCRCCCRCRGRFVEFHANS